MSESSVKNPFAKVRALLIDIDDTIIQFKKSGELSGANVQDTGSLSKVLSRAGTELAGLPETEVRKVMEGIKKEIRWWHWSDFIVALGLDAKVFWDFAYEVESEYLEATDPEIPLVLKRLKSMGYLLYITSNNPSSGILHKLRLAGTAHTNGSDLFHQLLGAAELQSMKWEPVYWKKVLAHTGLSPEECAVVGDNLKDDFEIPQTVGMAGTFLFRGNPGSISCSRLIPIQRFKEISKHLADRSD